MYYRPTIFFFFLIFETGTLSTANHEGRIEMTASIWWFQVGYGNGLSVTSTDGRVSLLISDQVDPLWNSFRCRDRPKGVDCAIDLAWI